MRRFHSNPDVPRKKFGVPIGWWNLRNTNHICVNIDCGYNTRQNRHSCECPNCKSMIIGLGWHLKIPVKGSQKWKDFYATVVMPSYEKAKEAIRQKTVDYKPPDEGETIR